MSTSSAVLAITTRSSPPTTSSIPRASLAPPVPPARTTTGREDKTRECTSGTKVCGVPEMPASVRIREVGPRDGFQNDPEVLPTDVKVRLIELLGATGLRRLEVTSF